MISAMKFVQRTRLAAAVACALALSSAALAADVPLSQQLDDAQREGRIYASYALNRHLNPFDIKVDVNGSTAVLSGTVEDGIDKDLAEQIALNVSGIQSVDNRIKVDEKVKPIQHGAGQRSFGEAVEDATITAGIKSKLLWNEHTSGLAINVDTRNGAVMLTGAADSESSRDLAGLLAANTQGVRSVDNRLTVSGETSGVDKARADVRAAANTAKAEAKAAGGAATDAWITTKVKSSLLYSKHVASSDINVNTSNGVVKLTGRVDADAERDLAVELAKNVRGVKKVDASGLQVRAAVDARSS
jgi:hyperosmotically inducible protein